MRTCRIPSFRTCFVYKICVLNSWTARMATPTVLRVKRRLEENPQDALVLVCKRIKTDEEELSPSLFVFQGTVEDQETTKIKNLLPKTDIKLQKLPNVETIMEKIRKERKEVATNSRYKIVNYSRGLKESEVDKDSDDVMHLIDLHLTDDKDCDVQYAYDLYTSYEQEFDISMIDNFVGVEADLVFDTNDQSQDSNPEANDDVDDSNDEDNWRNDYPDSEASSIEVEDMVRAMEKVDIEDDLSSDTGEDKIYDDPQDISHEDVERYGEAYAKYKAKVLSENPDLSDSKCLVLSSKMSDDGGYKDDSDDGFYYGQDDEDSVHLKKENRYDSSDDSPD